MNKQQKNLQTYRCYALFSGGLDSMLAVLYMQKLGYEVLPIFFYTPFFTAERAIRSAKKIGKELIVHDITEKHLKMMKAPKYGFGKNMNPCIDCHGLMFKEAGLLMQEQKVDFIISGEVLGQRPMSQRLDSLNAVGKLSEVKDLLVRPLSQKLLRDTKPIRENWVNKKDMLDIQGRNRKRQMELAKKFGLEDYETPGGGCLLTDHGFSKRLKDLMKYGTFNRQNIEFLKVGRHLRLDDNCKLILGRNRKENVILDKLVDTQMILQTKDIPGPFGVLISGKKPKLNKIEKAASILLRYNSKVVEIADVAYGENNQLKDSIRTRKMDKNAVKEYLI